jgi:hypothetical protein
MNLRLFMGGLVKRDESLIQNILFPNQKNIKK